MDLPWGIWTILQWKSNDFSQTNPGILQVLPESQTLRCVLDPNLLALKKAAVQRLGGVDSVEMHVPHKWPVRYGEYPHFLHAGWNIYNRWNIWGFLNHQQCGHPGSSLVFGCFWNCWMIGKPGYGHRSPFSGGIWFLVYTYQLMHHFLLQPLERDDNSTRLLRVRCFSSLFSFQRTLTFRRISILKSLLRHTSRNVTTKCRTPEKKTWLMAK